MEVGSNFKENMKENIAFATVKGTLFGAITGAIGVLFANLVTSKIDSTSKDQKFTDISSKISKENLSYVVIGGIAGAISYYKSAKNYNEAIEGKWTIKVSEEKENQNKENYRM